MSRIKKGMSPLDAQGVIADSDPEAAMILAKLAALDKSTFDKLHLSGLSQQLHMVLTTLDKFELYGSRLVTAYHEIAHEDPLILHGIIDALFLGVLQRCRLEFALQNHGAGLSPDDLGQALIGWVGRQSRGRDDNNKAFKSSESY